MQNGKFVISLDFEMMWGALDKASDKRLQDRVKNVWNVVPKILNLFEKYEIHATWGVVGLLLFKDTYDLVEYLREHAQHEINTESLVYKHIEDLKSGKRDEKLYFCPSLIQQIAQSKNQEIASHTFAHFCAQEEQQAFTSLSDDLVEFDALLKTRFNYKATTYIPPRFQYDDKQEETLQLHGYKTYRGIRKDKLGRVKLPRCIKNTIKFFDRYINLLGRRSIDHETMMTGQIMNVTESYYLRTFNPKHRVLEALKVRRIKKNMKLAAKKGMVFHLWWHPHDFGSNLNRNLRQLESILKYYKDLEERYQYQKCSLGNIIV